MDNTLRDQLQTFESFFQAIGFKQRQGRVWGLLVLEGRPKSAADIAHELQISIGSTSECLTELREWGAVKSEFSPEHRCQLHSAVSDTLGIVATVLRRREQVAVQRFMESARSALDYVNERYGEEDPRAETLASIVSTAQIADAAIQFFVSTAGHSAQSQDSRFARVVKRMFEVGMKVPGLPKAIGTARKAALSVGADPGSTTVAKESRHA